MVLAAFAAGLSTAAAQTQTQASPPPAQKQPPAAGFETPWEIAPVLSEIGNLIRGGTRRSI